MPAPGQRRRQRGRLGMHARLAEAASRPVAFRTHAVHVFTHDPHSLGLLTQNAGEALIWTTPTNSWIQEQISRRDNEQGNPDS